MVQNIRNQKNSSAKNTYSITKSTRFPTVLPRDWRIIFTFPA